MKKHLTPIEQSTRRAIICKLHKAGFNVSTIANIMNINKSNVSRAIDKMADGKIVDLLE